MKSRIGTSEDIAAGLGAGNDGVVTSAALRAAGVTPSATARLHRRGVLQSAAHGVWKLRDHPWTWRTRARVALAAAGDGAVMSHRSAARLHRFYAYRDADDLEVCVVRGRNIREIDGRLIRTRRLPDDHVVDVDGLPATSIARTFFDLCGDPDHGMSVAHPYHERRMARVYNDALARRGLRFVHEVAVLSVMAKRGRAGTVLVRRLLDECGAAYEPTHSDLESAFVELIDAFGLPTPEKQVPISDAHGFIGVVDFAWRGARLVVEVDSTWHDGPIDQQVDAARDRRLNALGYTVRRYRYRDIVLDPVAVATELGMVLAGRPTPTMPNSGQ